MPLQLSTKKEIANLLHMTVRGVDCLVARKKIPVLKISRKCVRFDAERVIAALNKFEIEEIQ